MPQRRSTKNGGLRVLTCITIWSIMGVILTRSNDDYTKSKLGDGERN